MARKIATRPPSPPTSPLAITGEQPADGLNEFERAVQGDAVLYEFFGNRVVESIASNGRVVAVKVQEKNCYLRSEARMMSYASSQAGIKVPQVLGCYDVEPYIMTLVSDRVPGLSLDRIWADMTKPQQESIKNQLREQLQRMRTCTQQYIGRPENTRTYNFYDRLTSGWMGPWSSETDFDEWCLARVQSPIARLRWKMQLPRMRGKDSRAFVLTHGDLSARNIVAQDGIITGIVDWEYAGFFPEYMEYVLATEICSEHEEWWLPVLKRSSRNVDAKDKNFRGW